MSLNTMRVEEVKEIEDVVEVRLKGEMEEPSPGQFVSLVVPGQGEYALAIGGYEESGLILYVESLRLRRILTRGSKVLIKGPLGRPLDLRASKVIGAAEGKHKYDLLFPLHKSREGGAEVMLIELRELKEEGGAEVLISAGLDSLKGLRLRKDWFLFVRWVKMNCMLGVCGICEFKGIIPCVEGPFVRVWELEDKGEGLSRG
jgi:hypothetical protein